MNELDILITELRETKHRLTKMTQQRDALLYTLQIFHGVQQDAQQKKRDEGYDLIDGEWKPSPFIMRDNVSVAG